MAYYNTCPECGAALDPGERCDCINEKNVEEKSRRYIEERLVIEKNGQLRLAV